MKTNLFRNQRHEARPPVHCPHPVPMKSLPFPHRTGRALRLLCVAVLPLLSTQIARAQSPGAPDPTFATGDAANGAAYAVALQGDGQVLLGGSFSTFRDASRNCIARVNGDGSLDSFNPGLAIADDNGTSPTVRALAVQANGKILAAGAFTVANQGADGGVIRLNPDGSLDASFDVGTGLVDDGGAVGSGYALAVLPNGQILVGGAFTTFNGQDYAGLVRLNADGSVDTSFNPNGTGTTGNSYGDGVRSIVVEANGQIVIGGYFSAYNGHPASGVARLDADGGLDTSFDAGEGPTDGGVLAVTVQGNGQVIVGGGFNDFAGYQTNHLLRLNTDGSVDTSYSGSSTLFVGEVDALLNQPDGSTLAGGTFLTQGGLVNSPHNGLARFLADGTQDGTFDSGSNARQDYALALQSDGKVVTASVIYQLTGNPGGDVLRYYDTPAFFSGEVALADGVFYLAFPNGNLFGYYEFLTDPNFIYHFDLGFAYVFDAFDGDGGVYFYDFASSDFFYTSPVFAFPYLYDFSLNAFLYYYPDTSSAGHYTSNPRYFYNFATQQIITR